MKRLLYYYKKIRTLSINILIRKTVEKIKVLSIYKIEKWKIILIGTDISNKKFMNVFTSPYNSIDELLTHISSRESPFFFVKSIEKEKVLGIVNELNISSLKNTVNEADKVCEHIFNLLGSGDMKLSIGTNTMESRGKLNNYNKINWHIDFKSAAKWNPHTFYREVRMQKGADRKVPWELSRFHHLATLGEAYWLTGDAKYAKEALCQIKDWMDSNKPQFGINWHMTMDVAIRVCNWILGFYFFRNSKEITDEFLLSFLKSLYQHGKHIMRNLEKYGTHTNHYLSNIVGLVYIGVMFPEFKEAKRWKEFGINELIKEMDKQVYPDGCDFEASTCYHRLVLELFFFSTLLVVINDGEFNGENYKEVSQKIFGNKYTDRLFKMFEAVLYLLKPNGQMPQIGDNDSGMLHIFANREVLDMRYLLALGAIFFRESKFKIKEFGFCEESLWIFGEEGYSIWRNLEGNSYKNINSKAFPNAGWYVLRHNDNHCLISCGPNGPNGNGGHAHNDKLSFELMLDGQDIIIDPGTYLYTPYPEERNKFRSTGYHNTVVIDGLEQGKITKNLFSLPQTVKIRNAQLEENEEAIYFTGEIDINGTIFKRRFSYNKNESSFIIEDKLSNTSQSIQRYFHLPSTAKIKDKIIYIDNKKYSISLNGFVNIIDCEHSSSYGHKEKCSCIMTNGIEPQRIEIKRF